MDEPALTPDFAVSQVSERDHDTLFALHERLFRAHIEQIWGWHEDWQRENFRDNWCLCETSLIEFAGTPIGYLQTHRRPADILLKNIGIIPEFQGKGIGSSLIRTLQTRATAERLPLRLSVFVTNSAAHRFYVRAGFVNEDRSNEFQHMVWTPPPLQSSIS